MVKNLVPGDWVVLKKLSEWHEKDYGFYLRRHIGDKFLILARSGTVDDPRFRLLGARGVPHVFEGSMCGETDNVWFSADELEEMPSPFDKITEYKGECPVTKALGYVRGYLTRDELLTQLAEEAAELSQAALKYRRTRLPGVASPTPTTEQEALANLYEEIADVRACIMILGLDGEKANTIVRRKAKRWMQRIADSRKKG
ncbi:hypothetical protein [Mitsuokella jalaludinii]|uniref:hypothetical protein n=1 Tax=Mitsuokella jalaludinii TaxID=187979 RepID=UPI003079C162